MASYSDAELETIRDFLERSGVTIRAQRNPPTARSLPFLNALAADAEERR